MRMRPLVVALLLGPVLGFPAVGCSGVSSLSTSRALVTDGDEIAAVHAKVDQAVKEKAYADAWDLEAASGRDRARLETIALASVAADEGPYEKMFAELIGTFHGLSPEARTRIGIESKRAMEAKKWVRAAEIEIAAAEDAPAYKAAFGIYERTPPADALPVLERIEKARRKFAAEKSKSPSDGAR